MNAESFLTKVDISKYLRFRHAHLLPAGLPLLVGLVLGPLLALLIVNGDWIFVLIIIFLLPAAVVIIRYPFAAIMLWMLVMPWFPFKGPYKYIFFAFHRLLIPSALCILLLSRMLRLRKHSRVQLGPADLAMIAFGAVAVISIFVSGNHWMYVFSLLDRFLVPFAAYWLVRFSNAQERDLKRLVPLVLMIALAQFVIGLTSWFAPQVLPSIWRTGLIGDRVVGTFRQPASYALVLTFCLILVYHAAMNRKRGLVRAFLVLAFGLGMVCIFFTFTRSAWLAGTLVLLGLLYLYPKPTMSVISVVVPIMLILFASVLTREFAHASQRLSEAEEGAEARLVLANAGKNMFYARPIFGWGFANYDRYDWRFLERVDEVNPTDWQIQKGTSHDTYLTILAEMGALGFFLACFPVIWWLGLSTRALPRLPRKGFWSWRLLIALWLTLGAFAVVGLSIDLRFFTFGATLFWIGLAFIANLVQPGVESDLEQPISSQTHKSVSGA